MDTAIIRSVDVLIFGGSSAAVAAAVAAKQSGASVFVAAPRNYLGEDICGSLHLHLDADIAAQHPLGKKLCLDNPTPRALKVALEDEFITNDIDFVFGSYPVAALQDDAQEICGAIIANRAGRQAIQAKYIIDATPRALFARLAGAAFQTFSAQTINYSRRLLADAGQSFSGWSELAGTITHKEGDDERTLSVYECNDIYELTDTTPNILAQFEQHSYQAHWLPESVQLSEDSIYLLGDRLNAETCTDAGSFSSEHMCCLNGRCFVLSAYADLDDTSAQALRQPGALLSSADQLAQDIAALAQNEAQRPAHNSSCTDASTAADICSHSFIRSNGLRPIDSNLPQFCEDAHPVPELASVDVVVVGGGTGGAPAGIAAARQGASTIVLEFQSHLGGVGTVGQIAVYYFGNRIGFTAEIDQGVFEMGENPAYKADSGRWSPNWKQAWYHKASCEAGTAIWYQATVYGVHKTGDRVTGILVAGPFGHGLIRCGAVVDATGAAEVAANAGAPVRVINDEHIAVQGTGLSPISPIKDYNNSDHNFIDDEDMVDVTAAMVSNKYKWENDFDVSQLVNSRERQQIVGEWEVSPLDILCDRQFPDTVCRAYSNFDSHGFTIHPLFMIKAPDKKCHYANVPYRALIPQELDGVLCTGLGVSAHRDSLPLIRMQPDVQNQGYAAGCAAALSAKSGCNIRQVPLKHLQQHLIEKGCLEQGQLTASDNFPLAQDVLEFMVTEEWDTYRGIAVMLGHAEACKPLIEQALANSENDEQRRRYAHILCMLGFDDHAQVLIDYLHNNEWDDGWNYRGMGQYGFSLSPMDTYMVALSLCSDASSAAVVLAKAKQLEMPCDFSHARGFALAAANFKQRGIATDGFAEVFEQMLGQTGMSGFAHADLKAVLAAMTNDRCETTVRNNSLREIVLARALFLLDDSNNTAQGILESYASDMRGHFARHAQALLSKVAATAAV